ncbi:hypothetical protein [Streptomyces sp. NPDC088762]|uniref:hypothetical protein n=1 Tax=Streptomyces sp. NPDC088762 TaxID=3365891 RepID=UPI00380884A4
MGFIKRSAVAIVGGAALAALTATGATAHAAAPSGHDHGSAAGPTVYCGAGWGTGLAVMAKEASECSTALKVEKAYAEATRANPEGGKPVTVRVDGVPWKCETREGDPNPYIACVNQNNRSEEVQLTS